VTHRTDPLNECGFRLEDVERMTAMRWDSHYARYEVGGCWERESMKAIRA
jgi:hypothetical protein